MGSFILMDDSNKVYFQDSRKYLFHYDFAKVRLKPFRDDGGRI